MNISEGLTFYGKYGFRTKSSGTTSYGVETTRRRIRELMYTNAVSVTCHQILPKTQIDNEYLQENDGIHGYLSTSIG